MKKRMSFLILAVIGVVCMRFTTMPKPKDTLFVDGVVTARLNGICIVSKEDQVVARIETDAHDHFITGFGHDGLAAYFTYNYTDQGIAKLDFGFVNTSGEIAIGLDYFMAYEFSGGLAAVGKGRGYGYIDKKGNTVIDFKYENALPFNDGSMAPVKIKGRYGYIDKKGEIVIERQFDKARSVVNGMAVAENTLVMKNHTATDYYIINEKTKEITKVDYDSVGDFGENGLAPVCKFSKWGYINTKGEEVIKPQFREAGEFASGLAPVIMGNKMCAYIDEKGEIVMQFEDFTELGSFHNGLAWFVKDEKVGYINKKGEIVIEPQFGYSEPGEMNFKDDGYAVVQTGDHKYGVIDKKGNFILRPIYSSISTEGW